MKKIFIIMILFSLTLAEETKYELKDGSVIVGDIVSQTETEIVVDTKFGWVTILKSDILIKKYTIVFLRAPCFLLPSIYRHLPFRNIHHGKKHSNWQVCWIMDISNPSRFLLFLSKTGAKTTIIYRQFLMTVLAESG